MLMEAEEKITAEVRRRVTELKAIKVAADAELVKVRGDENLNRKLDVKMFRATEAGEEPDYDIGDPFDEVIEDPV